jgi:hypothetical protein
MNVTYTVTFQMPAGASLDDVRQITNAAYAQVEDARVDDEYMPIVNITESLTVDGQAV